jgi:DNA-binding NtrC family response regulator
MSSKSILATVSSVDGTPNQIPILVVDDDTEVREILAETLSSYGYAVRSASTGEEALLELSREPGIRLLISDVRMAGMSGIELVDRAVAVRPQLRVILMSGYFLPQHIDRRFLKKPFRMRDLAAAVAEELGVGPHLR